MDAVTQLYTSSSLSSRVAAEVRSQTAKRGLKQVDIANLLNMSQPQISLRLRGKVPFRLDELEALATHFGIDPAELMPRRPGGAQVPGQQEGLLRLDLNQQPFGYKDTQVRALQASDASGAWPRADLRLISGQSDEYQIATRSGSYRTFVPVIVPPLTVSA